VGGALSRAVVVVVVVVVVVLLLLLRCDLTAPCGCPRVLQVHQAVVPSSVSPPPPRPLCPSAEPSVKGASGGRGALAW
jgi:hypothetical protein